MATFAQDCLAGKAMLIRGGLGAIGKVVVSSLLSHSARPAANDVRSFSCGRSPLSLFRGFRLHYRYNFAGGGRLEPLSDGLMP